MEHTRITELTGGLLINDSAVTLAIQLEARGYRLSSDRGVLKVSNGAQLTLEDIAAIRRLRHHLIAIAVYPEMGNTWHFTTPRSEAPDSSGASQPTSKYVSSSNSMSSQSTSTTATTSTSQASPSRRRRSTSKANAFAWDETVR